MSDYRQAIYRALSGDVYPARIGREYQGKADIEVMIPWGDGVVPLSGIVVARDAEAAGKGECYPVA